jgi:hypothetical protein
MKLLPRLALSLSMLLSAPAMAQELRIGIQSPPARWIRTGC